MKNYDYLQEKPTITSLAEQETGGTLIRLSMFAAAIAVFTAIAVPFAMDSSNNLVAFDQNQIDTRTTGSIQPRKKRFTIRKSILDQN